MSFADRLKKLTAMGVTASAKPGVLDICHPVLLLLRGHAMGVAHIELAPMLVGGVESTRLLMAFLELFDEMAKTGGATSEHGRELDEAVEHLRKHLASVSAAAQLARDEHQKFQHGKEPLH